MNTHRALGWLALAAYIGTIFLANWLLSTFGVVTIVGLAIPAGVFAAGAAFPLRDTVHDDLGPRWVLAGIAIGAALSAALSPQLALASATAFTLSELSDFAVYAPLRRRGRWLLASILSNLVGGTVDSAVFLLIAFHSLVFLPGQLAGKYIVGGVMVAAVWAVRWTRTRRLRLAVA